MPSADQTTADAALSKYLNGQLRKMLLPVAKWKIPLLALKNKKIFTQISWIKTFRQMILKQLLFLLEENNYCSYLLADKQ